MRIIAGELKGRKLFFVQNRAVRPMTQKVREAIFDILSRRIEGAVMLDLFCGSGGVGIEALSRGASHVDFVDLDTRTVCRNVRALEIEDRVSIHRRDAVRAPRWLRHRERSYDFIFVGAPYDYPKLPDVVRAVDDSGILACGGLLMVEHRRRTTIAADYAAFSEKRRYDYGQTTITLFEGES